MYFFLGIMGYCEVDEALRNTHTPRIRPSNDRYILIIDIYELLYYLRTGYLKPIL